MRHRTAMRLLPCLPDHTLEPAREAAVRAHAAQCGRCARRLAELRASEALLARLPLGLVPIEASPRAESRLAALARWVAEPPLSWRERGVSALGALAAATTFTLLIELGSIGHFVEPPHTPRVLAAALPETHLFPTGVR